MSLEKLLHKIRINFFAEIVAVGIIVPALADFLANKDEFFNNPEHIYSFLGLGVSLLLAKLQNQKYDKLVHALSRQGYDERLCNIYMDHLCGRSVVKAALKRTGHFDHYADLKKEYPITRII